VTKKHQRYILKLIELEGRLHGDYSITVAEVRSAVTKSRDDTVNIFEVSSEPSSNVLKLFMLQIVFKMFQKLDFTYSDDVLSFFLNDEAVLNMDSTQKSSIIKLILSIGRIGPTLQFKLCMNLKFLQYLQQFKLKFESFITNMTRKAFIQETQLSLLSLKIYDKVPRYLHSYAKVDHSDAFITAIEHIRVQAFDEQVDWDLIVPDAARSNTILKLLRLDSINPALVETELSLIKRPTPELMNELGEYILKYLLLKNDELTMLLLFYVDHTWHLDKNASSVFDKTLMNIKQLPNKDDFLRRYFKKLWRLYSIAGDTKRLRNLSNVSFNLKLCQLSLLIERDNFYQSPSTSDIHIKYKKALKLFVNKPIQESVVTATIFDDCFLSRLSPTLLERLDAFDQKFGCKLVFSNVSGLPVADLSQENRAIVFSIATKYITVDFSKFYERLDISDPILQMLCGVHYLDIPSVRLTKSSTAMSTSADPLIKCFYYLSMELRTRSTTNIIKILNLYINSWISRNKCGLTCFEISFIQSLVSYLKFINFQKLLKKLLSSLEKYKAFKNEEFNEWLKFEELENILNLKEILSLSPQKFDLNLTEDSFLNRATYLLKVLPFKLLKLKYFLINYDQQRLTEAATDIYISIESCPTLFSIDNKEGFARDKFVEVLALLVTLMYSRSKFLWVRGEHMQSVTSAVAAIQLSKSILKSDPGNLLMIEKMSSCFRNVINTLIHLGLSKDSDYYVGEFSKFNISISSHKPLHAQNSYFIANYLYASGRQGECESTKTDADKIFDTLNLISRGELGDQYVDNYKLIYYRLLSDIFLNDEKTIWNARSNIKSFLTFMEKEGKILARVWKLNYEYHFNSDVVDLTLNKSKNPYLNAMNYMLNSRRLFINAQSSLNMDPLYSTLEDSAMAIPSVVEESQSPLVPQTSQKIKSNSMRNVKKSIIGMRQSKGIVIQLLSELRYLANYQRNELHRVLSLDLLTLSSISNSYDSSDSVEKCVLLNNHVKTQPLLNERSMISITSNTGKRLPDFTLENLLCTTSAEFQHPDMSLVKENNWQVISIDVSSINDELIITRLDDDPKMLKLPLTRLFVRTGEDINFKLHDCLGDLRKIISESDETMKLEVTSKIVSPEQRKEWHETRATLDDKLSTLLMKIEHYWIGGFKGIFSPIKFGKDDLATFKRRFLNIIRVNIPTRSHKSHGIRSVEIDDFVVELFLRLGNPSTLTTTEPLEDLIYFVLDILLFHGEKNAYDEVDIDNIYVQTETLLGEYFASNSSPETFSHTVLVLGKELHSIPWENIPCLREQSISRVPSVSLLVDMLNRYCSLTVEKMRGSFIVNPGGDLQKTEDRFGECLKGLQNDFKWTGTAGVKPTEDQFKDALESNLFFYVGHGAGTSYIRETTIKNLSRIAPSLLLGCSSAALKDNHFLDPSGTVFSYMIGGCPMILGNLWDVTDKDIDKFTLGLFKNWGLLGETSVGNICDAVRLSRDECKLKYLNGAAPVVYGLPLALQ
jgi:separase